MKYVVKYQVVWANGEREAGPYDYAEALTHYDDIRGYEGVYSAFVAPDVRRADVLAGDRVGPARCPGYVYTSG